MVPVYILGHGTRGTEMASAATYRKQYRHITTVAELNQAIETAAILKGSGDAKSASAGKLRMAVLLEMKAKMS
jgi:hypothetical protein